MHPVPTDRFVRGALSVAGMPPRLVGAVTAYKLNVGSEREMAFRRVHEDDTAAIICDHLLDTLADKGYCPKLEGSKGQWSLTIQAPRSDVISVYAGKTKFDVLVNGVNAAIGAEDNEEPEVGR